MKCPYCNIELKEGTIFEIGTGTNGAPAFMTRLFYTDTDSKFSEGRNVGRFVKAYYCVNCHKVFGELISE